MHMVINRPTDYQYFSKYFYKYFFEIAHSYKANIVYYKAYVKNHSHHKADLPYLEVH